MTPRTYRRTMMKGLGGVLAGVGGVLSAVAGGARAAPAVRNTRFRAADAECTSRDEGATVTCRGRTVRVSGTMIVPDPCHDGVLRTVEHDRESGEFRIVVGAEPTDGFCVQCVAAIDYEFTAMVDGCLERVVVYHEGGEDRREITTAPCNRSAPHHVRLSSESDPGVRNPLRHRTESTGHTGGQHPSFAPWQR